MLVEVQTSLSIGRAKNIFQYSFVGKSENISVVGPSGAGKTTLLRILAGLETKARGLVKFKDDIWQDSERGFFLPPWQRQVGWVPQDALLFPHLSVRRNLKFSVKGAKACEKKTREVADLLGISNLLRRRPRHLSGGEKQRVALGRALMSDPRCLLLDEPFSALDENLRGKLMSSISEFCKSNGISMILVTHNSAEARLLCDEVWEVDARSQKAWKTNSDLGLVLPTIHV
jgi:ABC-type sugar transport system ATPase subunit